MRWLQPIIKSLASLRLTVWLFGLAMFLIFAGTLAQSTQGIWPTVEGYFRSVVAWIDLQLFIPRPLATVNGKFPFPGGSTIGALLLVNLLAAHIVRFKLAWKRAGIILLHGGLILLLIGEFVTGQWANEGLMSIDEGTSAHYIEDIREVELAIIDRSDVERDRVIVVPQELIADASSSGQAIALPGVPLSVRVDRWMLNSQLIHLRGTTVATAGIGLEAEALPQPEVSGVDSQQVNAPSAYIQLLHNNQPVGTWLVSVNHDMDQVVEAGDHAYGIALRFKRTYKPYRLHLIDFRHDKFTGTEIARNFSSHVRLIDESTHTDREVVISMNQPLRYAGETFYQASYKPDNSGTVLQVVRNPGWLIPYISCMLVTIGLLWHFLAMLGQFLRRSRQGTVTRAASAPAATNIPGRRARVLLWVAGAIGMLIAFSGLLRPAAKSEYDIRAFGRIPVSADGRVKPFDTVARTALMVSSGKSVVRDGKERHDATTFLLDLLGRPEVAMEYPVVRIDHPDLLTLLDQPADRAGYFRLTDLQPHWDKVAEQAGMAGEVQSRQRDPFQRATLQLFSKVNHLLMLSRMESPYAIPPLAAGEEWRPFHTVFLSDREIGPEEKWHPGVRNLVAIMTAYHEQKPAEFNAAVADYRQLLAETLPAEVRRADFEVLFNRAAPFYTITIVYVLAFLVLCAGLLLRIRATAGNKADWAERFRLIAVGLIWAGFIVHTIAICARIYLQGRPPVTNLYSSAVFVGWAAVLLGLMLERFFPTALAAIGAACAGALTMIVAHNLGSDGDTMQMMQAVLDSNFWLATHVITIALGYSTTFLAGLLGIVYILLGLFTAHLTADRAKVLTRMVYAVVCFGLLFSFVGTVLGGIWADQSWGRFWGWDPKENGAALVVLINALILHARWGGMIQQRGIMVAAVVGNIITAWSWFGTNMLGVGLHSYGFMDSAVFWLMAFVFSQIVIIALGSLPVRAWRSGISARA